MAQNITLKIGDREFEFIAETPEMEALERRAAEAVNRELDRLNATQPRQSTEDKLSIIALSMAVRKLHFEKQAYELEKEARALTGETNKYLETPKS